MGSEYQRRFSLEKVEIDPSLKNRIFAADGDDVLGSWNGEKIDDLVEELDRIETRYDANYNSLPHSSNIPDDLRDLVEKDYPIWACDRSGMCLVGEHADKIKNVDKIRKHYEKKHGGVDRFREKVLIEIEKRKAELRLKK